MIILIFILFHFIFLFRKIKINFFYYIYFFIFLHLFFIFSAYLMTDAPLEFMLKTGIDRLTFQASGFYILFIMQVIKNLKYKKL